MATKRKTINFDKPPETLKDHMFYGLKLDQNQQKFRDAIWNPNIDAVFCSAAAGSGKSLIAVATAVLMCKYDLYKGIHYIVNATQDGRQGFLPGEKFNKDLPYMTGLWSALETIGQWPERAIKGLNMDSEKQGDAFITAESSTYLRGSNIGGNSKKILIVDESQNATIPELRKILTRACEGTKVIVIGHDLQCDININASGFAPCRKHFMSKNNPRFAFCELTKCYRGLVAETADQPWEE